MKAYQVLMYGQLDEVDYETTLNLAVVPNPVEVPWKPLVKTSSSLFDPNLCYFFDDHTGVTYEIAEIEINP
jgi:hypothetical protein